MKLKRLKLHSGFRSLHSGFEVNFLRDFDMPGIKDFNPYCLVGRNGSGKSNILEVLSAIFYHIECIYLINRPDGFDYEPNQNQFGFKETHSNPDAYELEYFFSVPSDLITKTWSEMGTLSFDDCIAHITITKEGGKAPEIKWLNRSKFANNVEDKIKLDRLEVKQFLPSYVIAYSSGENETLSLPYLKMSLINYDEYENRLKDQKGYNEPEGRLIYLDKSHSQAIFLTNYLMQDESVLQPIHKTLGIKSINQFRIIINQFVRKSASSGELEDFLEDELLEEEEAFIDKFELTELLKQSNIEKKDYKLLDKLIRCATTQYTFNNKELYLDYFIDNDRRDDLGNILKDEHGEEIGLSEMKKAFRAHFNNDPFELFRAFQILLTLNLYDINKKTKKELYKSGSLYVNETIPVLPSDKRAFRFKDFTITKENSREPILTKALSDGEHQFLHAMGLCLLFRNTNSLFLLDEPETHLNPDWRAKFISTLRDCFAKNEIDKSYLKDLLITSHSPFIISDCHEENVLVFKKDDSTNKVEVARPGFNTFGSSVNKITMKVFGKFETIGSYANELLNDFYQKIDVNSENEELIDEAMEKLGDSVERLIFINKASAK